MKKNKRGNRKSELIVVTTCFLALVIILIVFAFWRTPERGSHFTKSNEWVRGVIPRMDIELNQVSLDEIKAGSKDVRYGNNELTIIDGSDEDEYGNIEIKGRGNTGWFNGKRSFQIKFPNKIDLFGMGKGKKWVLLPNYIDATSLRNDIAFLMAKMVGERFADRGKFVEVSFNGEYEGLYYVMHKVEISKESVDVRNESGVLFELDDLHGSEEEHYESYFGEKLVLKDMLMKKSEQKEQIIKSFLTDYNEFEKALEKEDYSTVSRIIDIDSFVEYYLINEFTVNPDAYLSSFYLYRNDEGKICAGPVWDFDYALGNREWIWQEDDGFFSPIEKGKNLQSKMMKLLIKTPVFQKRLSEIFEERLQGKKDYLLSTIIYKAHQIDNAVTKNNKKWNKNDFRLELKNLLEWVERRYDYFETEYGKDIEEWLN